MELKHFLVAAFFCALVGVVWTQNELPGVPEIVDNLPPELQGKVNASEVEAFKNKSEVVFKQKCEKNGGLAAFANAQKAYEVFPNCVRDALELHDMEKVQAEIEAAKPNGTVDEVFKKYCQKTPQAKQCFKDLTEAIKPCFSLEEQKNLKTVYNISEQLAEFICFKDGDRIALFIAEGGPECMQDKQNDIQECVQNVYGKEYNFNPNITTANITFEAIPEIKFGEKECGQLSALQRCVVSRLEACSAPTSANIVESLFKFARQATPCKAFGVSEAKPRSQEQGEPKPKSASTAMLSTSAILFAVVAALY